MNVAYVFTLNGIGSVLSSLITTEEIANELKKLHENYSRLPESSYVVGNEVWEKIFKEEMIPLSKKFSELSHGKMRMPGHNKTLYIRIMGKVEDLDLCALTATTSK